MCGICGIMRTGSGAGHEKETLIRAMTNSMAHRGPDDSGIWQDQRVSLGHRRLSVIDLSEAGHQPMANEDGTVIIAYNGEVYNFRELKAKYRLEERGHRFISQTDTEVLVHLYEEIGMKMLGELNGMFAFAVWDGRTGELHLGRDRYGIKPLFIQNDAQHFRFASEIKAIIADSRVPRRASMQALHDYLSFNYIPGTQTAFEGIHEVPPGHYLTVRTDGTSSQNRYWDLDFTPDHTITEEEAAQKSFELMNKSLERRLIADVPIGVFLSGGLDSSTLVALMSAQVSEPVHTYSLGFEEQSFNELPAARIVAEAYGTRHREVLITAQKVRDMLPRYLAQIDEPYGDGSAIPTWYVSELARKEVVVALSGEGGDEAFAGYDTYAAYNTYRWARRVPGAFRNKVLRPLINRLPVSHNKLSLEFKLKRFLGGLDLPPHEAHMWWRIVLDEEHKLSLYSEEARTRSPLAPSQRHFADAFAQADANEVLSGLMYIDSTVFMPDDLMIKNDRMSMAHSLETRVPFTDPELTAYLATVPAKLKMKGGRKKHLMRLAMNNHLPDEILNKKKVGLEMPYSRWLKEDFRDLLLDYLGPDNIGRTGIFRPDAIKALIDDHLAGRHDHGRPLWGLLNYMMWHRLYIEV